jgi:Uma2 family endonuclease
MTLQEYQFTPMVRTPQELIFGTMRAADAPLVTHQRAVFAIARALQAHVDNRRLGEVIIAPTDVVLDARQALVVQPDVLFVSRARSEIVLDRVYGAPDLVIEVLSPHPRIGQLDERIGWFASYGVREIWLYHLNDRQMDVLSCADGHIVNRAAFLEHRLLQSAVLPAFARTIADIVPG